MDDSAVPITDPCPLRWVDLQRSGAGPGHRYCGQCRRHVLDGSSLTRAEFESRVSQAEDRPCVRFELHEDGTPIYAAGATVTLAGETRRRTLTHIAAAFAATLLAACGKKNIPDAASTAPDEAQVDPDDCTPGRAELENGLSERLELMGYY